MNYRIPLAQPDIGKEELRNVTRAVKSGWVSSKGEFIYQFEKGFSDYINVRHAVSTSSGTAALHLALSALSIGKGDKVLVPSLTFVASANSVKYTGATPVFIDSHPEYWCIDPSKIEENIDKHTRALMVVHLYGHPCDMEPIMRISEAHKIHVIEDCAEAHGAEYKGRKAGSFGIVSCFSFYGNKVITTGEGGMCLTSDEELAEKMRILRDHGMSPERKYWHPVVGFNYRMTNLQAALGVAQLGKIARLVRKKRAVAHIYRRLLSNVHGVTPAPEMPWARNIYWLYAVLVGKRRREKLIESLDKHGIESRPFFYPQHTLPPYKSNLVLPVAERLSREGVNLPCQPGLLKSEIEEIVEHLACFISRTV